VTSGDTMEEHQMFPLMTRNELQKKVIQKTSLDLNSYLDLMESFGGGAGVFSGDLLFSVHVDNDKTCVLECAVPLRLFNCS
jgi:hypothetical protein